MKELGVYLRQTRIENGVSLEEAAEDMNISVTQLENIESGNTKAFKDVYKLKQHIKFYAKYLGLNPEKVVDNFNEFLFEHTSRISLDDIKKAREGNQKTEEEANKIKSPYTIYHKPKLNLWPIIVIVIAIVIVLIIVILVMLGKVVNTKPRTNELKTNYSRIGDVV